MLSQQAEITIRKWYSNSCCAGETANCISWVSRMGFRHKQKKADASGTKIPALSQTEKDHLGFSAAVVALDPAVVKECLSRASLSLAGWGHAIQGVLPAMDWPALRWCAGSEPSP